MTSLEYIEKLDIVIKRLKEIKEVSTLVYETDQLSDSLDYFFYKQNQEWKRYYKEYKFLK